MPPERSCREEREDGTPCEAPSNFVDPETGFCPAHGPGASERLSEAARKGGRTTARKRRREKLDPDELPPLESPQAAERWCDIVGRAVVTGRLTHNQGKAALRAVREWRESHETGAVTDRLEELMDALSEWRRTGDPEPVLELVDD